MKVEIDFSGNGLETIPEEIFKLKYIKKMKASFNLISEWDDVPVQLESLILNDNRIYDITGYATQMTSLSYLDLSNNVLPTINPLNRV